MGNNIVQIATSVIQLGLLGFLINWAKTAFIDRVNDQEKRIQKLENLKEFEEKYLNKK